MLVQRRSASASAGAINSRAARSARKYCRRILILSLCETELATTTERRHSGDVIGTTVILSTVHAVHMGTKTPMPAIVSTPLEHGTINGPQAHGTNQGNRMQNELASVDCTASNA